MTPRHCSPDGEAAKSSVYHIHFLDHQLPADDEGKARFAREYAVALTGANPEDITYFIQQHAGDPRSRVAISVPQRLADAVRRIEESGLRPVSEPQLVATLLIRLGQFRLVVEVVD